MVLIAVLMSMPMIRSWVHGAFRLTNFVVGSLGSGIDGLPLSFRVIGSER